MLCAGVIENAMSRPHLDQMNDIQTLDDPITPALKAHVAQIVARQRRANGVLMKAINFVGGQVEDQLRLLPDTAREQIEAGAKIALRKSYEAAHRSRGKFAGTDGAHKALSVLTGAIGGLGGLPTAIAELPVATTIIFRAVQGVAAHYGEDPLAEETRAQCLAVFGAGGPGASDDGVDTSFFGARLGLSGAAINGLISSVAPKFAAILSQKLATQAVPILGAAAGAGTNYAFTDYYVEMAHVHFALRQLAREHDETMILDEFHKQLAATAVPVQRR